MIIGQLVGMGNEGSRDRTYDWYYFILNHFGRGYDVEEAGEIELRDWRLG